MKGIPPTSRITEGFGPYHYADTYSASGANPQTLENLARKVFAMPSWVLLLLRVRNLLVKPFGISTEKPPQEEIPFTVIKRYENEWIMEEKDIHLNFRASILQQKTEQGYQAYVTTLVHFNNWLGRLYFIPVRPFHKLICSTLIKRSFQ